MIGYYSILKKENFDHFLYNMYIKIRCNDLEDKKSMPYILILSVSKFLSILQRIIVYIFFLFMLYRLLKLPTLLVAKF